MREVMLYLFAGVGAVSAVFGVGLLALITVRVYREFKDRDDRKGE